MKTNAVRLLEQAGIAHEVREYDVDPDDLSAETVAAKVGLPACQVFKTLVVRGEPGGGIVLAVVPGDRELDLKAIAKAAGFKKAALAALKEVEPLTGYIRGAVTAIGCRKPYPVYLDERACGFPFVSISAGRRGMQILLDPRAYIALTGATLGLIAAD
jgi:Cys-tRNA(Pro)/Cys-tRNA(Cys) deacylase